MSSNVMQEYLAEAYRIAHYQKDDPFVTTSALAARMHVTAPAVAAVVQRLKKRGLVDHEPYRGIKLTEQGEHNALMSIRRHRLAEVFMVKVMGFGWHEVHDEADALGEVISDHVAARMEVMAGYPKRCPHGEPIPTAEGIMPVLHDEPLSDLTAPQEVIISRVNTHDPGLLQYLASLSLIPGQPITLLIRAPFNGPFRLKIGAQEQVIGYELARCLRVEALDTALII